MGPAGRALTPAQRGQVAISARVKALEDAIPAHQQRLGLKGGVSHSAEDLGMRVDRLEEAMKALLTAQVRPACSLPLARDALCSAQHLRCAQAVTTR